MRLNKNIITLLIILLIATMLRFYKLGTVPTSLNADEAAIGYNAYSILKTGKDEYGKKLPLLFQSFDDYKLPVYVYLTVPSVAVFGLNDFSVRFPSALLGILTVGATYFFVAALFANINIALIASFLLAISPWHLQFSRSAYEANTSVFFLVLGMMVLLRSIQKHTLYIWGFISLAISIWTYHSSRIFIPLIVISFIVLYHQIILKNMRSFVLGLIVLCAISLPLYILSFSSTGLVRARGVSALDDVSLNRRNALWRVTDIQSGIPWSNIYHNQRLVSLFVIMKGYLDHYNPNFFFSEIVQGKYHAPGVGLLYLWELPFLLYGIHAVLNMKVKGKWILLLWFLFAPIAASPTQMLPHPVRTLVFLPSLQIFVAVGIWEMYTRFVRHKKAEKLTIAFGLAVIIVNFWYYLHQYYTHMPIDNAKDWQYGHKEVVDTVKVMQDKFDTVVVSTTLDQPYIFFLYYLAFDPAKYLSFGGTKSGKFDEEKNAFDIYEFHTFMKSGMPLNSRTLYVGTPTEVLSGAERLVNISYPSGENAYVISAEVSKKDWNEAGNLPYLY